MADTVVAIHQPNFLPWLGFFDKLANSDVFVFLDNVQFSRGSRTNRVQVLAGDRPVWLTAPVERLEHGEPLISDARIDDSRPWRKKALRTLEVSYGRHPGFPETFELVTPLLLATTQRLAELNEAAIESIVEALELDPPIFRRAKDLDVAGDGADLLAALVEAVGGDAYLSGGGAGGYMTPEPFARRGIELRVQRFAHPEYPQRTDAPVQGLSVVDAMMSVGSDAVRRFLR